ncbi:hypothetical protein HY772_05710 [Candidatus Woesearchaeota archaeon]|nr:hypothetical protein [Candidatus Woesearchaeota archaeon]
MEKESSKSSSIPEKKQSMANSQSHAHDARLHDTASVRKHLDKHLDIHSSRKQHAASHEKTRETPNHYAGLLISLIAVLALIVVYNFVVMQSLNKKVSVDVEKAQEAAKPALISLTAIYPTDCAVCKDLTTAVQQVKKLNVNVTSSQDFVAGSLDAQALIEKYAIKKLPALLIKGDVDKLAQAGLEKREGALIFADPEPPYYDLEQEEVVGDIIVTIVKDSRCAQCSNLMSLVAQLEKGVGIVITETKQVELSSSTGQQLVQQYGIKQVPALLFSSDASAYPLIVQAWPQVGTVESDGTYVLRQQNPPYMELPSRKIVGLVNVVYLTDKSCTACYDVNNHRQILTGFGMSFAKEETVDVSAARGAGLVKQYTVTKVPTIVISGDVSAYRGFDDIWKRVGSIESDGSYVFRNMEAMRGAVYKDLSTGNVVTAETPTQ